MPVVTEISSDDPADCISSWMFVSKSFIRLKRLLPYDLLVRYSQPGSGDGNC